MMRIGVVVCFMMFSGIASAQQSTPLERALAAKIMVEINSGLQCDVSLAAIREELAKTQARVKELEAKLPGEPKP